MDMSAYGGKAFIGVDDVRDGPVQGKIAAINLSQWDRPVLVFESGGQFSLNVTNTRDLLKVYGKNSESWIGHVVELFLGDVKDANGETKEGVRVKAVSRPASPKKDQREHKSVPADPDDEIPF
jgi:hypothetical protein